MPFVNIRTAKGLLSKGQKQALHDRLTKLLIEIEGDGDPDFKQYIMILIDEQGARHPLVREKRSSRPSFK